MMPAMTGQPLDALGALAFRITAFRCFESLGVLASHACGAWFCAPLSQNRRNVGEDEGRSGPRHDRNRLFLFAALLRASVMLLLCAERASSVIKGIAQEPAPISVFTKSLIDPL